jgi:hypothetical protein
MTTLILAILSVGIAWGQPAGERPYVRLLTFVHRPEEAATLNSLPPPELERRLEELTRWYVHFSSPISRAFPFGEHGRGTSGTTLAEKLVRRGAVVSQYRNGSYVSQGSRQWGELNLHEAEDIERRAPLAIGTFWPGHKLPTAGGNEDLASRLATAVDGIQTSITVTSAARHKPADAPVTWPYVASRGRGAEHGQLYSDNTHDFVSWIRLEDEILRVLEVASRGPDVVLRVERGYFGTKASRHAAGARVFSPVYIGSTLAARSDMSLAGSPPVDSPEKPLRYAIKIWLPEGQRWIAEQIRLTFGAGKPAPYLQGHNAVWLDITGCASYNTADAYGRPVNPWDDPHDTVLVPAQIAAYNISKRTALDKLFRQWGYPQLHWFANNLAASLTEGEPCNRLIAEGGFAGCALENWLQRRTDWELLMRQNFLVQANDWPAIYWAKWAEPPTAPDLARYKRFTYGAVLLAYRPTAARFQYGGGFGLGRPDQLYFWDWGRPEGTPSSLAELKRLDCGGVEVYRRDFENGVVLVNSGSQPGVCEPGGSWLDVAGTGVNQAPPVVSRVNIGPRDAAFLMKGVRPAPKAGTRPYVKLFALTGNGKPEDTSEDRVRWIARTFGWINSHGGGWLKPSHPDAWQYFAGRSGGLDAGGRSFGDRLRALNPNIILTNYRNGSYTSQNALLEAAEQERRLPLAIAVHDTEARLAQPVSAAGREIVLTPPAKVPADQPAIYPFRISSTDAQYSIDKRRYVSWLRLGDEILRIDRGEARDGRIVLGVSRGIWNTRAVEHGLDRRVLAPVYSGRVRADGREYYLSGLPEGNSPQPALRYVFMQQREEFWEHLAGKCREAFEEGLTGPWLDTSVSTWINHSNAYGVQVEAPWDLDLNRPLDRETHREYQQRKFDHLFRRFPNGRVYVNWFFPQFYFDNGHEKWMFSGENGHHPISGGAIEMYANENYMEWHDLMRMQLDMVRNRYTVAAWAKRSDTGSDDEMPHEYTLFAYATHLLVYEVDAPQYWGGAFRKRAPYGEFTPPPFVFWDLGAPRERFKDVEEARAGEIYHRRFEKGLVVVNPDGKKPAKLSLDREHYDTESGRWLQTIELPPRTGRLLLTP